MVLELNAYKRTSLGGRALELQVRLGLHWCQTSVIRDTPYGA